MSITDTVIFENDNDEGLEDDQDFDKLSESGLLDNLKIMRRIMKLKRRKGSVMSKMDRFQAEIDQINKELEQLGADEFND